VATEFSPASVAQNAEHERHRHNSILRDTLSGKRILVLTSGHDVFDHRIFDKEAVSLRAMGARVLIVGKCSLPRGEECGIRTVREPSTRLGRFLRQPWRCFWAARNEDADIVHIHDSELLAMVPFAKLWWPAAKIVYDVHEDFPQLMLIRDWIPTFSGPIVRFLTDWTEKLLTRFCDGIVAVTPALGAKFSKPLAIARNFPTQAFLHRAGALNKAPRQREYDLVHLGTLNRSRATFLSQVLEQLHARRPSAKSLVLGASIEMQQFLAERLPPGCTIVGKTPHELVPESLVNCRIGIDVHPETLPHLRVAVPVKVLEYMASSCAVVSSSMPVLNEVLLEANVDPRALRIVESCDVHDYVAAVESLLDWIAAGGDPGARLRRAVERQLNWDSEAENIACLYTSLLTVSPR
jgi:glycosyltransferase involved in cell wall biosynthesis